MSKLALKLDEDDFWCDCLKENNNEPLSVTSNNAIKNMNNNNNLSKTTKLRNKIPLFNYKKLYHCSTMNYNFNYNKNNHNKNTVNSEGKKVNNKINAMVNLYQRGMENKKLKTKNIQNLLEIKQKKEIGECSFKPLKYDYNKSIENKLNKRREGTTIYERGIKYQQRHLAKLAKLYEENSHLNNVMYSFRPEVKYTDLNKVFYAENYCKDQADNDSNKIFLFRLMKAREEEMHKKSILENPSKPRIKINWSVPKKLTRSVSQKDSLLLQKKLHDTLLDIKCSIETDNNNEDMVIENNEDNKDNNKEGFDFNDKYDD